MIELEAGNDPEAVAPIPPSRKRRRTIVVGATLLAVVAGAIAVAAGGSGSEPKPLALMAGNGAGLGAETMAARNGSPAPAIAAQGTAADSRAAIYPYGGWGLKFEVEGQLPDLPDHAAAWRVNGPALDRTAITRIAEALGLEGSPVQRDGGWFVEGGEWTLNAFGGDAFGKGGPWSINLFRSPSEGTRHDSPAGPAISKADAERRVRELLDRMGAPSASWKIETTETEIGVGWACAAPAPGISPEELRKLEADKPAPDAPVASCPPPPPAVKGFSVALSPVLDGSRTDWSVWNVTLRSDGALESLYGSWVSFEGGDDYKLRGVDAALKDLQSLPVAYATDLPATAVEPAAPDVASCPPIPMPMPMPAEDDRAVSSMVACAPPVPQVVKITGVDLGLTQTSVFEDGQVRLALVPSYRFVGHFDNGMPWETSVIALHPDAIAPPPARGPGGVPRSDYPVDGDVRSGGGATGVGKAVPPTPPAEPAVVRD